MWGYHDYRSSTAVWPAAPAGWMSGDSFDSPQWHQVLMPIASPGHTGGPFSNLRYNSHWYGEYNCFYFVRTFDLPYYYPNATYTFNCVHDDNMVVYVNGSEVINEQGWTATPAFCNWENSHQSYNIPASVFHNGKNIVAVYIQQNWGGAYFDCGILRTEGTRAPLTLTNDKWHTFVAPGHNVDFSSTNVKAFKIVEIMEGTKSYAHAEEVTVVPADQAVVVRSASGAGTYQIPVTQATADFDDNLLKATLSPFTVTVPSTIYCVAYKNGVSGFFPVAVNTTVPKGKGYLDFSGSSVKPASVFLDDEDDPTAIEMVNGQSSMVNGPIFNLAGQRLQKMQRGLNIVGKTKVLK
jgi:hypothetical protein